MGDLLDLLLIYIYLQALPSSDNLKSSKYFKNLRSVILQTAHTLHT